jgi:subtilisin family serine protease
MASPHVAGVGALYKAARGEASQATIDSWLKTNATANVITGNVTGTPNRLLFKSSL